jgi:response regulator NasT
MRVWVVEDQRAGAGGGLASLLKALTDREPSEFQLLGAGPLTPGTIDWLRGQAPDLLVIDEFAWPEAAWAEEVLAAEPAVVVVTARDRALGFRSLAERYPLVFVSADSNADGLWLAVLGAAAARRRHLAARAEVERLQQRLRDRILIEKAKGVLVRRLHITEDEAYNRLRVLSRRQRRPMRDIAESFLETQDLLVPGENGSAALTDEADAANGADKAPLPR